jgi:hypothetical protein
MKPIITCVAFIAACLATQHVVADPESVPSPPARPKPAVKPLPPVPAVPPPEPFEAQILPPPADAVFAQAPHPPGADNVFHIERDVVRDIEDRAWKMVNQVKRVNVAGRTLAVPGNQVDTEQLREMEEDLNVMARVLEKAVIANGDDGESRKAMGIELLSLAGSSSGVRNLYLEGHGALFLLRVGFPLLAPPRKEDAENATTKEPASSAWEEARSDLYGGRRREPMPRGEEFDEQKVERLKDSLLDALRNATHIRHLQPTETITVMVAGESARPERGRRVVAGFGGGGRGAGGGIGDFGNADVFKWAEPGRPAPARGDSTLLVRVKKSDADAFAADKMGQDEFRKKATILAY